MATDDESEYFKEHLSERVKANGWRVISNPTSQPNHEDDELKILIQTMQGRHRAPGKRKKDESEPPEAA